MKKPNPFERGPSTKQADTKGKPPTGAKPFPKKK